MPPGRLPWGTSTRGQCRSQRNKRHRKSGPLSLQAQLKAELSQQMHSQRGILKGHPKFSDMLFFIGL